MSALRWPMRFGYVGAVLIACLGLLAGCDDDVELEANVHEDPDAMLHGEMGGINYTPYYIHEFYVSGHGNGIKGGGPNIMPRKPGETRSWGGGKCCGAYPDDWRPGLKVTVRWLVDKKLDGVTYGSWYIADTELPEYGPRTGGVYAIFLPEDRVKIMVNDGNANGHNDLLAMPTNDDPYIAVGTVDEETNRKDEAMREKWRAMAAREAEYRKRENKQ